MKKLPLNQRRLLSEFLANIGVAWFAGGVIAPVFINQNLPEIIIPAFWGVSLTTLSLLFSLRIIKG
ncbi:hypothetical protein ISS42_02855 [Candidatus Shapirobacteria bacterium]|nr:hypothetical protein [Candidatus Shapirobacteria bacterium]